MQRERAWLLYSPSWAARKRQRSVENVHRSSPSNPVLISLCLQILRGLALKVLGVAYS